MAGHIWFVGLVAIFASSVSSAPTPGFIAASATVNKPPITFDGANVGVNFGGYHASAGLGGILSRDVAKGGLHAEAGTALGQSVAAGLGGGVAGGAAGGLYAGANSGAGQVAEAGLGGVVAAGEASGGMYAAAESSAAASASTAVSGSKSISGSFSSSYSGSAVNSGATVVSEQHVQAAPKKTYIERTVIPNYVEKTVQVPSYVEKTIRVPTVITKKVKVEAAPTVIEKTVETPQAQVSGGYSGAFSSRVASSASTSAAASSGVIASGGGGVSVIEQETPPLIHSHWVHQKPLFGGFFAGGGLYGGGSGVGASDYGGGATYTVRKSVNRQLINDIFNIPIQTLGAVNKLVGGIAGGASASGSFAFNKHYGY